MQVFAQEKLSLTDAVALALKNNYSILNFKNEATIAANNNTAGNAGLLPSVSATASEAMLQIIQTKYASGLEVDKKNVASVISRKCGFKLDCV